MEPISYSYPEPPLPSELQAEIDASVARFKEMWPGFLKAAAEEYAPRFRAEITTLVRKAYQSGGTPRSCSDDPRRSIPERAETPVQRETEETPEKKTV